MSGVKIDDSRLTVPRMDQRAAGGTFRAVFPADWSLRDKEQ